MTKLENYLLWRGTEVFIKLWNVFQLIIQILRTLLVLIMDTLLQALHAWEVILIT